MSKEQNSQKDDKALHIADVMAMLPTQKEIDKKKHEYGSHPFRQSDSYAAHIDFEAGVQWVIEKIKDGVNGN